MSARADIPARRAGTRRNSLAAIFAPDRGFPGTALEVYGDVTRADESMSPRGRREREMNQFEGKVALITGGNAGIGRATAIEFARLAAKVVITGRRENEGRQVVEEIKASGGDAIFVKTDVSKERDVAAMVRQTLATFGRLDFAFNNAGIEQVLTPLPDQTEEAYDQIMDINVKGVWLSLKHEIPAMLKTGGGAIVNTSSIAGLIAVAMAPIYIASKHAVIGLTKAVALEYARQNIRVNAVAPGTIETRMFYEVARDPQVREMLASGTPVGRVGRPEEIASIVTWLCSDSASYVTGQTLAADGGYTAQ
jgi:NAD(P)-dependent dehydrogenase (short-subunit alcohol dehydrogenase family)